MPSSLNVTYEEVAEFRCQHSSSATIEWYINGTSLRTHHPPNVVRSTVHFSGATVHKLSIQASLSYNETLIQCTAYVFLDQSRVPHATQQTPPATLLIQGEHKCIAISANFEVLDSTQCTYGIFAHVLLVLVTPYCALYRGYILMSPNMSHIPRHALRPHSCSVQSSV